MIQHPAVFAAVRDAIFLADIDTGMIVDANPAAEALSGRTIAELQLLHYTQLHPLGVAKAAGGWFDRDSQSPVVTEGSLLHKEGRQIAVEISSSHFATPDGRRISVGVFRDLTERRLAEAKLKESQDRLRVTFFQAAVGIAQTDIEGHWLLLNDRFCEILGYSREQLAGRTFLDITYPDDREACLIAIRRLLSGAASSWSTEKRYIRNDGVIIWGKCFLSLVRDEGGGAQYFIAVVEDITRRIEAERALQKAEQRLTLAQSAAHLGVWSREEGANLISISGEYARLHGLSADRTTVTREEWFGTIHPDDRERVQALRREARERTHSFDAEYRVIWPDGSTHWLLAKGALLLTDLGRPIGTTGVNMDITERKQVETALHESQQRYKEVFDITSECIFLLDVTPDARFKFAGFNPAEEKAVGFLSTEVTGKFIEEVVDKQVAEYVIANYRRCLEMGTLINYEEELVLPVGRRYFHTNLVPVRNAAGRIYRIVGIARDITGFRQTEEALRLSQQRLELAQEAAGIGSWDCDLVSGQRHCSKQYSRLYGHPAGQPAPSHENWLQSIHPEDRARVQEELSRAMQGTARYESEFRVVWPDGTVHWLFGKGEVLRDSDGRAISILGVNMEISERKYADQALRESEERFRNMADTAPVMIWVTGPDKLFSFVNKTWLEFVGRGVEHEVNNGWVDSVHPDDLERFLAGFDASFDARETLHIEHRLRRADGEYRWVLCSGVPRFSSEGVFAGYIGSDIDITDVRRAEQELALNQALRQSEEKYHGIVEMMTEGVWILDSEDRTTFVNQQMAGMLGYRVEEMLGRDVLDFKDEEDRPMVLQKLARRRQGVTERYDYRFRTRDGRRLTVLISARPLWGSEGRYAGSLVIISDITERSLQEEQVHQAHKMEAIGRLAGGVAHDFNNLLTVINGRCDLLLRHSAVGERIRAEIAEISNAGQRAQELTSQMLAFSRGQIRATEVLSLQSVIEDVEKMLRRMIGEDIELVSVFEPGLGQIKADPTELTQVLLNLAVNARDAMPNGGTLTFEIRNLEVDQSYARNHPGILPGAYVLLTVVDTGIGMDAELQKHLFEPFFTTKPPGKGTGLGLATVYGIVSQNNGRIEVDSKPRKGTTFRIYWPRVEGAFSKEKDQAELRDQPLYGNETVLVVEDQLQVRKLVFSILKEFGYQILEASDGEEALRLVETHAGPLHLLLTDVIMPGIGGLELATRLKAMRPLQVLFMTGYPDRMEVGHDFEVAYLKKPFTSIGLVRKVREVLDGGASQTVSSA
jgi:two-component system, cell cycle sensor histidine kinase and response regulator CckA